MTKPIPIEIDTNINREVLAVLKGSSCHSDIVMPLQQCLSQYKDIQSYCPDGKNFSFICWYVNNIIFAYANGMQEISIRLAQQGDLDFNKLKSPDSFQKCNSWYSITYNSEKLSELVESSYESATNS
jgi:hypothetical protein